jgi:hypothetical protein
MLATPPPRDPDSNIVRLAPRGDRRKPGTQPDPAPVTPRPPVIDARIPDNAA